MKHHLLPYRRRRDLQFNMTSMIDVVFLLIIFFMLICQFIVRENYRLFIPDDCANAVVLDHLDHNALTVSVFPHPQTPRSNVLYAVRSRQFDPRDPQYHHSSGPLVEAMSREISLLAQRRNEALVHLRADRDLCYGEVQNALLALAQAGITKVQLAAFRSDQNPREGENASGQAPKEPPWPP